jgi:hypothetical protein
MEGGIDSGVVIEVGTGIAGTDPVSAVVEADPASAVTNHATADLSERLGTGIVSVTTIRDGLRRVSPRGWEGGQNKPSSSPAEVVSDAVEGSAKTG